MFGHGYCALEDLVFTAWIDLMFLGVHVGYRFLTHLQSLWYLGICFVQWTLQLGLKHMTTGLGSWVGIHTLDGVLLMCPGFLNDGVQVEPKLLAESMIGCDLSLWIHICPSWWNLHDTHLGTQDEEHMRNGLNGFMSSVSLASHSFPTVMQCIWLMMHGLVCIVSCSKCT